MQILRNIFLFILVATTLTIEAQTNGPKKTEKSEAELSKEDVDNAILKYKDMLESQAFKRADSIEKIINIKLDGHEPPSLRTDSLFIPWSKENFHLTAFKSYDEMIDLRNKWKELLDDIDIEYLPLYKLMSKASKSQIAEIVQPYIEMRRKELYPELYLEE